MNARQHYAEAERLLGAIDELAADESSMGYVQARLTRAHVHALLAQTASANPAILQPDPIIPPEPPLGQKVLDRDGDAWMHTEDGWQLLDPAGDPALYEPVTWVALQSLAPLVATEAGESR